MTLHDCPPFTELPLAAPCGEKRVMMTMDPKRTNCRGCIKKRGRRRGIRQGKATR